MNRTALLASAALIALAAPALSQAPKTQIAVEATKPGLTVAKALSMLQALRNMDGRQVILKQGGNDTVVTQPWDFGSGTLRLAIAKNVAALAEVEKAAEDARVALIRDITRGGGTINPGTPEADRFQIEYAKVLDAGAQVTLQRIKAADLKLDKNEIPVTALAALDSILDP